MGDNKIFEIPKKRIGIRPSDLIQRIVLFVEDTKIVEDRTLSNFAVWSKKKYKKYRRNRNVDGNLVRISKNFLSLYIFNRLYSSFFDFQLFLKKK